MAVDGTLKFSTLFVAEISAEFKSGGAMLSGKAAFMDKTSGATHAWTKGEGAIWSPETIAKLQALRESMEADLARLHMTDHVAVENGMGASPKPRIGGILEHLETRAVEADQA